MKVAVARQDLPLVLPTAGVMAGFDAHVPSVRIKAGEHFPVEAMFVIDSSYEAIVVRLKPHTVPIAVGAQFFDIVDESEVDKWKEMNIRKHEEDGPNE